MSLFIPVIKCYSLLFNVLFKIYGQRLRMFKKILNTLKELALCKAIINIQHAIFLIPTSVYLENSFTCVSTSVQDRPEALKLLGSKFSMHGEWFYMHLHINARWHNRWLYSWIILEAVLTFLLNSVSRLLEKPYSQTSLTPREAYCP